MHSWELRKYVQELVCWQKAFSVYALQERHPEIKILLEVTSFNPSCKTAYNCGNLTLTYKANIDTPQQVAYTNISIGKLWIFDVIALLGDSTPFFGHGESPFQLNMLHILKIE